MLSVRRQNGPVIAITRYRVPATETESFVERAGAALKMLQVCRGYLNGHLGRSTDEPGLWAMVTEWEGAGFYRRALGAYEVRVSVIPLSALAIDEPGAYEVVPTR
jgi:Antibiotic biosynthesis monooxygenase